MCAGMNLGSAISEEIVIPEVGNRDLDRTMAFRLPIVWVELGVRSDSSLNKNVDGDFDL